MRRQGREMAKPRDGGTRLRLRLRGAVQGVGFRPFAYGLATRFRLGGFVRNDAEGVLLEIEGARCAEFLSALETEKPPLARIESIELSPVAAQDAAEFVILDSAGGAGRARIIADVATCDDCLSDLFDPVSRFHLYPFVTCTQCGPRFTISAALPYDRARTAMAGFSMCAACARDYADPRDRRFHAEAIACPDCGPRLDHDMGEIVEKIAAGAIVALKGIGGYQLICDARNDAAVAALRRRKDRDAKPFAVMAADAAAVEAFAAPTPRERSLLESPQRPIVLIDSKQRLAPSVAPGLARIGVMLPCAPVHHLLFHHACRQGRDLALIATSANAGGAPILIEDADARRELSGVADLIVGHDRPILARADDSVMAVIDGAPAFLRRARGFAPEPIDLGSDGPCVLALGGHLKTTVTLTRGREAFVSQHIGDLDDAATRRFYAETLTRMSDMLGVRPEIAACDLHPDFYSTRCAETLGLPLARVQHHAAHVAAVAAEHGLDGRALGVAFDGYGMGDDGGAWGGELMLIEGARWRRLGHLAPLPAPGGDRAARECWRMGVAALHAIGRGDAVAAFFPDIPLAPRVSETLGRAGAPATTSMGRLFDAVAALSGLCLTQAYEGQAAMMLEARVDEPRFLPEAYRLAGGVLDFTPTLAFIARERPDPRAAAAYFHGALIAGCAEWITRAARAQNQSHVALGGGCLMNRILAEGLCAALRARGLTPLLARAVPCNDGGLSLGQAHLARAAVAQAGQGAIACV